MLKTKLRFSRKQISKGQLLILLVHRQVLYCLYCSGLSFLPRARQFKNHFELFPTFLGRKPGVNTNRQKPTKFRLIFSSVQLLCRKYNYRRVLYIQVFFFSDGHYLALINRAGGLYGRILTEVVSTDRTQ